MLNRCCGQLVEPVFAGRSFDVVSDGAFIEPGHQVKVIDIQGNRIMVAAVEEV